MCFCCTFYRTHRDTHMRPEECLLLALALHGSRVNQSRTPPTTARFAVVLSSMAQPTSLKPGGEAKKPRMIVHISMKDNKKNPPKACQQRHD